MCIYIHIYNIHRVNTLYMFDGHVNLAFSMLQEAFNWAPWQGGCLPNSEGILQDAGQRRGSVICSKTPLGGDSHYLRINIKRTV